MKYIYAYKTSDGVRHEDLICAASREEVFVTLRAKGIKAIKVVAADGSKANGEVHGIRICKVIVLVVLAALIVGIMSYIGGVLTSDQKQSDVYRFAHGIHVKSVKASPRHQIYGDPAVMEEFERGELREILPRGGDRLLAVFAQPGKLMCTKGINPDRPTKELIIEFTKYAANHLSAELDIEIEIDESREIRELKEIINGMRHEMRIYLANGNGTPLSYWKRLNERTRLEAQIYERTRRELEKNYTYKTWLEKNAALRRLGIRTIPTPGE